MKVRFHRSYDHRWPSRAVTHYPAGWEGTVKRIVGYTAIAKGCATETHVRAIQSGDAGSETSDMAATGRVAGGDGDDDSGAGILVLRDALPGERQ